MNIEQLKIFVDTLNKNKFQARRRWELDRQLYALAYAFKDAGLDVLGNELVILADSIENMDTNELLKHNIFE